MKSIFNDQNKQLKIKKTSNQTRSCSVTERKTIVSENTEKYF